MRWRTGQPRGGACLARWSSLGVAAADRLHQLFVGVNNEIERRTNGAGNFPGRRCRRAIAWGANARDQRRVGGLGSLHDPRNARRHELYFAHQPARTGSLIFLGAAEDRCSSTTPRAPTLTSLSNRSALSLNFSAKSFNRLAQING
jgi:hypothetical protein